MDYKPTRLRLASLLLLHWATGDWVHEDDEEWTFEEMTWLKANRPHLEEISASLPGIIAQQDVVKELSE